MKFYEVIRKRHSIREYEKEIVPKSKLIRIVRAATMAPSAKNEQPWRFYVISRTETRERIIDILHKATADIKKDFGKLSSKIRKVAESFYKDLGNAPHIIFVYRIKEENAPKYKFFNDVAGVSCAIENLMLSAVAEGLGTCWIGTFKDREREISKLIGAPMNQELMATILVGYPRKGYKPLIREKRKLSEVLNFIE